MIPDDVAIGNWGPIKWALHAGQKAVTMWGEQGLIYTKQDMHYESGMKAEYERQEDIEVWKWYMVWINGPQQLQVHFSTAIKQ